VPAQLVCDEPMCGFLMAGAIIKYWQVTSLFASGSVADLYTAVQVDSPAVSGPSKMMVKVLRAPTAVSPPPLEEKLTQLLSLRHQYINPLAGAGRTTTGSGLVYFVTPFAQHGSLSAFIPASTSWSPAAVASIVGQIAEALFFAHQHNVVHGRLKLENCLVAAPGSIRVSDFIYSLLNEPERFATSAIVAPEQFYGPAEAASDQYTLALLAYQLLVGQLPFIESSARLRPALQEQSPLRPVTQFRRDVSALVDHTLGRALSRRPEDRYATISDFAQDMVAALNTGSARSPSAPVSRVVTPLTSLSPVLELDNAPKPAPYPSYTPPGAYTSPGALLPMCVLPGHTSAATVLRWAPDGVHLASAGKDQSIHLWRVHQRVGTPVATLTGHSDHVLCLSWSPDSLTLASGGADATVRTWILAESTIQTAWWGHDGSVAAVDWSPTGAYIASGGQDRTIRLWDRLGNVVGVWQAHGRGGVTALAWSPDGRILASGGSDHLIHLWDPASRALVVTLEGHTDEIRYLDWSPNGRLLASYAGKKDLRIGLWDTRANQLDAMIGGHPRETVGLLWSRDSAWLAGACADGTIRYWDTHRRPGQPAGLSVRLEGTLLSMVGAPGSGMIAVSLADLLIQVFQLQVMSS
jgi:eukaryotic-like serine/threonine-protein kinase